MSIMDGSALTLEQLHEHDHGHEGDGERRQAEEADVEHLEGEEGIHALSLRVDHRQQ
ncbi:hypothetical protein GCM10027282_16910 [Frigoribacterium salinisoli]